MGSFGEFSNNQWPTQESVASSTRPYHSAAARAVTMARCAASIRDECDKRLWRTQYEAELPGTCGSKTRQNAPKVFMDFSLYCQKIVRVATEGFSCFDGRLGRFSCRAERAFS